MTENLYCKIFIDTVLEYNDFFETVRNFISGQKKAISGINSGWCDVDIRKNKEYITDNPDFLYWKFIIDIEPKENISGDTYINNIRQLVYFLKQKIMLYVPATLKIFSEYNKSRCTTLFT